MNLTIEKMHVGSIGVDKYTSQDIYNECQGEN